MFDCPTNAFCLNKNTFAFLYQSGHVEEPEHMDIKVIDTNMADTKMAELKMADIKMADSIPRCSLTQCIMNVPLRNSVCGHYYDEQSLLQYLKDNGLKAR